ncbi:MAG TPA: transposase [Candidatus Acidoferrales bacterium]
MALWLTEGLRKHSAACGFDVHAYCVMPDYMHVLAATSLEAGNLIKFVESFKQDTAVEFMRRTHHHLWQFKYYDHILRASDSLEHVAGYIWMNPVRQGLCRAPSEYAFLGSFTEIGQKMLRSLAEPDWTPPWKRQSSKQNDAKSVPR